MQQWFIPVLTVLISTFGALVSVAISRRAARIERLFAADELATRFGKPLLHAAFNLETRIYNMVELDFFGRFLGTDNTESEKSTLSSTPCTCSGSTSAGTKSCDGRPSSSIRGMIEGIVPW